MSQNIREHRREVNYKRERIYIDREWRTESEYSREQTGAGIATGIAVNVISGLAKALGVAVILLGVGTVLATKHIVIPSVKLLVRGGVRGTRAIQHRLEERKTRPKVIDVRGEEI